mmetsp:Transcript_7240/g.21276  ORF Transcript_7240/g.21276 Transcript_7240/m.21276 type:complete len:390 (+) Transcript_7240:179-1348(+)
MLPLMSEKQHYDLKEDEASSLLSNQTFSKLKNDAKATPRVKLIAFGLALALSAVAGYGVAGYAVAPAASPTPANGFLLDSADETCAFCPTSGPESCTWTPECADAVTITTDAEAKAWAAKGCDHVGGSMAIKGTQLTADGLKKLTNLTRVCGALAIQELHLKTLDGLDNLRLVGGAMAIQENAWGSNDANDYLTSLDALHNLDYVGYGLAIQQNYHLAGLGGFDPRVGGDVDVQLYPGCADRCGGDFTCLSGCTVTAIKTKCATCKNSTLAPTPVAGPEPTPRPTSSPQPTSAGTGRCCYWSPSAQDPCSDCEGHWAPPGSWCDESPEKCGGCGVSWCPAAAKEPAADGGKTYGLDGLKVTENNGVKTYTNDGTDNVNEQSLEAGATVW